MTDSKLVINVHVANDPPESFWPWPRLQVSLLELYEFNLQEPLPGGTDMPQDPHLKEHDKNRSNRDALDATGGERCNKPLPSNNDGEELGGSQPPTPFRDRETPADQIPTSAPCARTPPTDQPIQTSCQNPTPYTSPVTIQLGEHIASVTTYDIYRGRLQTRSLDATSAAANVVVKFCDPWVVGNPDITEWMLGDESEMVENALDVIDVVKQEARIIRRLGSTSIVPRFYGLWRGDYFDGESHITLFAMVLEDVGASLSSVVVLSSAGNLIPSILKLYETLHHAGVVHNDIEARHVHTRMPSFDKTEQWDYIPASDEYPYNETRPCTKVALPLPSLCLIDFEGAVTRSEPDYEEELKFERYILDAIRSMGERRAIRYLAHKTQGGNLADF